MRHIFLKTQISFKNFILKILFILIFTCQSQLTLAFDYDAFTKYAQKAMEEWGTAGGAIAIVKDGKIEYIKCFGVMAVGGNKPVKEDTQFTIVSLTKAFTALLLMKLQDEKRLDLNKPVQFYLPDFKLMDPAVAAQFKVIDLLSHNSGLPMFAFDSLLETGWSESEIYAVMDQIPLKKSFGDYDYQNIFPGVAGMLIQKVTGEPLSALYKEEIFDPLGFQDTTMGENGLIGGESLWTRLKARVKVWFTPKVEQHYLRDGKPEMIKGRNPIIYRFPSSRGINASIRDMAKWMQFLQTGKDTKGALLLPEDLFKIPIQKRTPIHLKDDGRLFPSDRVTKMDYGLGWFIHDYASLPEIYSHMGGMTGTRSLIVMAPTQNIGMVVLLNVGGMRVSLLPEALRSKFLDMALGLEPDRDWSKELLDGTIKDRERSQRQRAEYRLSNPQASRDLDAYVGEYTNKLYGKLTITKESSKGDNRNGDGGKELEQLVLRYRDLKAPLTHWNDDKFTFEAQVFSHAYSVTDMGDVFFDYDPTSNKANVLTVSSMREGEDSSFKRLSPTP